VQLKADNGAIHHLSIPNSAPVFRVFNGNFVHDYPSFADRSATPLLVLGAEDITKQEALKEKKA
jgi:hypothetical protein